MDFVYAGADLVQSRAGVTCVPGADKGEAPACSMVSR